MTALSLATLEALGREAGRLVALRDWRGDCYYVSALLALAVQRPARGLYLAHGTPLGLGGEAKGRRYGHAWVELGTFVFDLTVQAVPFDRESYYALGSIEDVRRYTPGQARRWLLRSTHYGPWES